MKKILTAVLTLTLLLSLFTGCAQQSEGAALAETGTLILRVNPEISVQYNKEGLVTKIEGLNDDGTAIVKEYDDYIGKECRAVVTDLVGEINEAGYFVTDVDGNHRNITIQIEPGSVLPQDDFLQTIASDVQTTVAALSLGSIVTDIGASDYDDRYASDNAPSAYITKDKAMEIALAQAGVKASDAVFDDREVDFDDGRAIYELEFVSGGVEYEYDIDAKTGAVLKKHNNTVGASNYGDTDYGPDNDGVTDYGDTDYGSNNDGVTDYGDTDYGPNNDGVTDYGDTDYGPNNDGVTDYGTTDYSSNTNYGNSNYDNSTNYGDDNDSGYGDSAYDD